MKRRGLTLLILLLWLAGCASTAREPTPAPTTTPAQPEGRTVITFWHGESNAIDQLLQQLIIDYQRDHPNIEVQVVGHGASLFEDYRRAVLAGGAPDLVLLTENRWIGGLADQRLLSDLSSDIDAKTLAELAPVAVDSGRYAGRLYGLPLSLNVPVLYYRANVFPSGAPPNTTDDLLQVARSLSGSGQVGLAYNLALYFTEPYLAAWGGQFYDADNNLVLATSSYTATANWLGWLRDLAFDPALLARNDHRAVSQAVQSGSTVMTIDWARNIPDYRQLWGDNTGIQPLPRLSQTGQAPVPLVRSNILALNPRSQPDQHMVALDLMRYLVSATSQTTLREAGLPTVRRDLPAADDTLQTIIDQAVDQGRAWPTSPLFNTSWDDLATMVRSVINGQPIDDTILSTERRLRTR